MLSIDYVDFQIGEHMTKETPVQDITYALATSPTFAQDGI